MSLKNILLASLLLCNFNALSNPCEKKFQNDPFIVFVKKELGKEWGKKVPRNWKNEIGNNTTEWKNQDKQKFLDFLINRIGLQDTLKIIINNSFSVFIAMFGPQDFFNQVNLYEKYIGENGVTNLLKEHKAYFMLYFLKGKTEDIERGIKLVETYAGAETVKKKMAVALGEFVHIDVNSFELFLKFISFHNKKEEISRLIMENDINELSKPGTNKIIHTYRWDQIVSDLVKLFGNKTNVDTLTNLKELIGYLQKYNRITSEFIDYLQEYNKTTTGINSATENTDSEKINPVQSSLIDRLIIKESSKSEKIVNQVKRDLLK